MARAKHTTRADARRRYRQSAAEPIDSEIDLEESTAAPAARSASASTRPSAAPQPARPGITSAFRGAYHPAQYREDVAAVPQLIRGKWFLISLALVFAGFLAWIVVPNTITFFLFQTLTLPPAMLPIFLVGFTAPRASYLLGLIVGLVDIVLYSIYVVYIAAPASSEAIPVGDFLFSGLTVGLPASVLFSAGAAWYRRFLALSNANRPRPSSSNRGKSGSRSTARR
ncbi:MAG: hypothetical protein HY263_00280 [Chloroflexi bacterium]|nr:hypothetical protein [Chloroflexota bacterium]